MEETVKVKGAAGVTIVGLMVSFRPYGSRQRRRKMCPLEEVKEPLWF